MDMPVQGDYVRNIAKINGLRGPCTHTVALILFKVCADRGTDYVKHGDMLSFYGQNSHRLVHHVAASRRKISNLIKLAIRNS